MKYITRMALLVLLTGCARMRTPVPLAGDETSINMLTGRWAGDYKSEETGRSGSITFDLSGDDNSAYGDILMVARPSAIQMPVFERQAVSEQIPRSNVEPIKVRFVRAQGGRIIGTLEPYKDPDCGGTLTTTFEGEFTSPDKIDGTFHSRGSDFGHIPADGKWSVTRQKPGTR